MKRYINMFRNLLTPEDSSRMKTELSFEMRFPGMMQLVKTLFWLLLSVGISISVAWIL